MQWNKVCKVWYNVVCTSPISTRFYRKVCNTFSGSAKLDTWLRVFWRICIAITDKTVLSIFQGQQVYFHGLKGRIQGFQGIQGGIHGFWYFFQGLKVFFKVYKVRYKVGRNEIKCSAASSWIIKLFASKVLYKWIRHHLTDRSMEF